MRKCQNDPESLYYHKYYGNLLLNEKTKTKSSRKLSYDFFESLLFNNKKMKSSRKFVNYELV